MNIGAVNVRLRLRRVAAWQSQMRQLIVQMGTRVRFVCCRYLPALMQQVVVHRLQPLTQQVVAVQLVVVTD